MVEAKSTCCGKCGHVHAKGTSCPKPFLTGKSHCSRRTNEMHTIDDDGPIEFHQVRADHVEGLEDPKDNPCWRGYHPVGTKMKDADQAYEEVMKKLHSGRGNLISKVENLRKLGLKTNKQINQKLIDRTEDLVESDGPPAP
jgi:hypothetical protein